MANLEMAKQEKHTTMFDAGYEELMEPNVQKKTYYPSADIHNINPKDFTVGDALDMKAVVNVISIKDDSIQVEFRKVGLVKEEKKLSDTFYKLSKEG